MNEENLTQEGLESPPLQEPLEAQSAESMPNSQEYIAKLESELEQNMQSFEKDFAKHCAEAIDNDPSLEELFFEDKEKFFEKILQMQNAFLKTQIQDKQEALGGAKAEVAQNEQLQGMLKAKKDFENAHPDINVEALMEFYLNELPKSIQDKLETLPQDEFFEAILELMQGGMDKNGGSDEELPKQVSGYPTNTQTNGEAEALPTNRY